MKADQGNNDEHKRTKAESENDEDQSSNLGKNDKQKRRKLRRRRGSNCQEEDIIDGFIIVSYSTLNSLELNDSAETNNVLKKEQNGKTKQKTAENGCEVSKNSKELKKEETAVVETIRCTRSQNKGNDSTKSSRNSPEQISDESSESGNSGYICDSESEDSKTVEDKKTKTIAKEIEVIKEVIPVKPFVCKEEENTIMEKQLTCHPQRVITSPCRSSSPRSLVISSSKTPSLIFSNSSKPVTPQSPWMPPLSSFQKPTTMVEPCYVPGTYKGPGVLHQELNNRFLQTQSDKERHSHSKEMHQHSHLHHHQHQHTHYYPSPLLTPTMFPSSSPVMPNVLPSPAFPTPPGNEYGSHPVSPFSKVHTEMSKDPHIKPEHVSVSQSTPHTLAIPPRHLRPSALGYHPPHLLSSRSSRNSRVTKPSAAYINHRSNPTPYGATVTSTTSAFSVISSTSANHSSSNKHSSSSVLYPWLKTEQKETNEKHIEPERGATGRIKSEIWSPAQQPFSVQALTAESSHETQLRPPRSYMTHDRSTARSPREVRSSHSYIDKPLPSLDKHPYGHRSGINTIDLTHSSMYPRFEHHLPLHSPHVTPITPPIGLGYIYPGPSFTPEPMYHAPAMGQSMLFNPRDPLISRDIPYYRRRDSHDSRER